MKINARYIDQVRKAQTVEDLYPLVQEAIELEHATIPPYLCGYFTLKLGTNEEVGRVIRSVVIEEMLHFSIASNLLLALGGSPEINKPDFVPTYPGDLPFKIGDDLKVHLRKCSIEQVKNTFMKIEEPEEPIEIPSVPEIGRGIESAAAGVDTPPVEFATIGQFYQYLAHQIVAIDKARPIDWKTKDQNVATRWFTNPEEMFLIDSTKAALAAINVIVDQGEGTDTDPFDAFGNPAHYYRFEEIVEGRKLLKSSPHVFGGAPVVLDPSNVWNMDDDPAISKYKPGSASHRMATQFSYSYTRVLNSLHLAFNGRKEQLDHAMGAMYQLRLLAEQVLQTPAEYADGTPNAAGKATGLSFQYQTLNN